MPSGVIIKGIGGFYYVKAADVVYECKAKGTFRKDSKIPLPGDNVSISVIDQEKRIGFIEEIYPRKLQLIRPAVANINQVALVISVRSPLPDYYLLDKLLITVMQKNVSGVICINKIDLDEENKNNIVEYYKCTGIKTIFLSAVLNVGFNELEEVLTGKTTVFAGQSGVGKSTILNRVMDSYVMETGNVSDKIDRGKHTTRHAELIELKSGGFVVDTPGFSSFEITDIEPGDLQKYYPEFGEYIGKCRFAGCSHISEPGCEVKSALEKGLISSGRYERYIEFYNSLKEKQRKKYS
ncbi:MAG: ribosome small subunit-dependent GTPase A [Clostridium sp.]|nr:ribosome small subunit-dependent GTPase A [Clostridium sp.]